MRADYSCQKPWLCYTQTDAALYAHAFEYPQDSLELLLERPSENLKVSLLGCEKELPWRYDNGKLIIDTTPLKYSDLHSTAVWTFKLEGGY